MVSGFKQKLSFLNSTSAIYKFFLEPWGQTLIAVPLDHAKIRSRSLLYSRYQLKIDLKNLPWLTLSKQIKAVNKNGIASYSTTVLSAEKRQTL